MELRKLPSMLSICCLIFEEGLATGHILRSVRGAYVRFVDENITDQVISYLRNTGFVFCVEYCLSMVPCKAISYDSVLLECRLIARELDVQSDIGRIAVSNIKTWNKTIWELKQARLTVPGCDIFLHPRNKGKPYECLRNTLSPENRQPKDFKFYAACSRGKDTNNFYILTERIPLYNTVIYRYHGDKITGFIEVDERRDSCWQWQDIAFGWCTGKRSSPKCIYLLGPHEIAVIREENQPIRVITPKYLKFRLTQELHVLLVVEEKQFFTFMEGDKPSTTVVAEIFPWKSRKQGPKKIEIRKMSMPIHSCGGLKIFAVASNNLYVWSPMGSRYTTEWRRNDEKPPLRDILWNGNSGQMLCVYSHHMEVEYMYLDM